jgi:hypothetical protein
MMEPMLTYHVLPELVSPEPYLRMRAIWLYGEFQSFCFRDQNHVHQMIDSIYKCLFDESLPVKVMAATTIYKLLHNNEIAQSFMRPGLKDILQVYLKLMTEIDSEDLVTALEKIVQFYKDDIEPYSIQLSEQLI